MVRLKRFWRSVALTTACFVPTHATAFDFGEMVKLIHRERVRSVGDLLRRLPPPFLQTAVFAHRSRGAQAELVSVERPRVIVHGDDLVLAFGGAPAPDGEEALECIEWLPARAVWAPRLITFRASAPRYRPPGIEWTPTSCFGCHSGPVPSAAPTAFRPNWDLYSQWPGMFGSDHLNHPHDRGREELALWARFVASAGHREPYAALPLEADRGYGTFGQRNFALGYFLSRRNARRVVAQLAGASGFDRLLPTLLATMAAPDWKAHVPAPFAARVTEYAPYRERFLAGATAYDSRRRRFTNETFGRLVVSPPGSVDTPGVERTAAFLFVAERLLGLDVRSWPLTFGGGGDFNDGSWQLNEMFRALARETTRRVPEVQLAIPDDEGPGERSELSLHGTSVVEQVIPMLELACARRMAAE